MSSAFHVEVATIDAIERHPNADQLELAVVKGWQVVTQKGQHAVGEKVVFVPPDSVLPQSLSDEMQITQYLSNGRLRAIKLRGEPSFGLIMTPRSIAWQIGQDVADEYGITKYAPPARLWRGSLRSNAEKSDALEEHALFWKYTDIDNLRHYPHILEEDEEVIVTEKLHGTNSRVGIIGGEWMAGSHKVRRKRPEEGEAFSLGSSRHVYWYPASLPSVQELLTSLAQDYQQVILFGEIVGDTIQSFHYGYKQQLGYRAFDLLVDGKYVDYDQFLTLCTKFEIPTVPLLAQMPYSFEAMKQLSEGKTTLLSETQGKTHIREGVVVKPAIERIHPKVGRVIFKYVSDAYLVSKASDYTEE